MSRRVSAWQEQLSGVLAAEDARREFDIGAYGGAILSRLSAASALLATTASEPAAPAPASARPVVAAAPPGGVLLDFALAVPSMHEEDEEDEAGAPLPPADAGAQRYEVCRTFLAALQLASTGNVELLAAPAAAASLDAMEEEGEEGGRRPAGGAPLAAAASASHLLPFRDMLAVRARGKRAAQGAADTEESAGWAMSQAEVFADGEEGAAAAASAAAASSHAASRARAGALSSGFLDTSLAPGFSGAFQLRLLAQLPARKDHEAFTAPSAARNIATGAAPDAGFSGSAVDVTMAVDATAPSDGSPSPAPRARAAKRSGPSRVLPASDAEDGADGASSGGEAGVPSPPAKRGARSGKAQARGQAAGRSPMRSDAAPSPAPAAKKARAARK